MKKEYSVVFHYSVRVEAEDEDDAQDKAWVLYGDDDCPQENFACTVEEVES